MNKNKMNQKFLSAYINLDKTCAKKLDTNKGVTEYINKLTNMRYASGRDKLLPTLTKYRQLRNRIAHEPGALQNIEGISGEDIKWLKALERDVLRGKDPVSKYLKSKGSAARKKAFWRAAALFGAALLALAAIAAAIFLL